MTNSDDQHEPTMAALGAVPVVPAPRYQAAPAPPGVAPQYQAPPAANPQPHYQTAPAVASQHQPVAGGVALPLNVSIASPWMRLVSYLLEGLLMVGTLWIGWLIWAAVIAGKGQTPAKKLLNLRVIGAGTLEPVGMGTMFWLRYVVGSIVASVVVLFTLGIILFMPFWDKRRQNLWDKLSNCYTVNDSTDAWARRPHIRQ